METRYKFRPIEKRDDTTEIKTKCYIDSIPQKETDSTYNTLYNDSYIRYPLGTRHAFGPPKTGIFLGGGNLAPTHEEMTNSNYGHYFNRKLGPTSVPEIAKPIPESDFMPHDNAGPMDTAAHLAMEEAINNRPPYDNSLAKERLADANKAHFFFGDDDNSYETDYSKHFKKYNGERANIVNNALQKSHIEFDKNAGIGPHTKLMTKKESFPTPIDPEKPEVLHKHFDIGYDNLDYSTTMEDGLKNGQRGGPRPESFKAPPCAVLSNHGDQAGKWETTNKSDFQNRKIEPNLIDQNDLRKTHWDIGHDENKWERNKFAVATEIPKQETIDLQKSNIVFRGNGQMTFNTTSSDLLGKFDRKQKARYDDDYIEARKDHLFLGGDDSNYLTTSQAANKMAGKGRPASMCTNLHLLKGTGFAQGGSWNQFAESPTDPDEKEKIGYYRPSKIDGTYFKQSHFDLDATNSNKGRYKTTYFEEICRPRIY